MNYYVEISSENKKFFPDLKTLWHYRYLIYLLTRKNFALSYKQTILGPLWMLTSPLLYSGIHSIVFGRIAGISTDDVPVFLYYLCSNSLWGLFSSCIYRNANVFRENQGIFGKVYFPRLTVPVSNIFIAVIIYMIQMLPAAVMTFIFASKGIIHPLWWAWLLLPLIFLHLTLLGMSVGLLVSSMTTKYRDMSVLVSTGVSIWMYATPIIYPLSQLKTGWLRTLVLMNPVTAPTELYRRILLGNGIVTAGQMVFSLLSMVVFLAAGIVSFNRVERTFIDTV